MNFNSGDDQVQFWRGPKKLNPGKDLICWNCFKGNIGETPERLLERILYCIDRRIYLNLFKPTQSAAGLKALKPAANGRYLMCKSSPYYFHLHGYRSTFILLSCWVFSSFRNASNSDMDDRIFNVRT